MNLWIVTIGSSDVQLGSEARKKWDYWCNDDIKTDYSFPSKSWNLHPAENGYYQVDPRILGIVYRANEISQDEIFSSLRFPLLDNFCQLWKDEPDQLPEAITVLLTDQTDIFPEYSRRQDPYWKDTCELRPILEKYFQSKFPGVPCNPVYLRPTDPRKGLDNWNEVLGLVRDQLRGLTARDQTVGVQPDDIVYVSHQAGTPALSSAVQFISLGLFDHQVKFLISYVDKQESPYEVLKSSSYLVELEKQKAKELLDRHDYAGVRDLVAAYLDKNDKILLEAATLWNKARFEDFGKRLSKHPDFGNQRCNQAENSWWTAYETAYLGFVRLRQDNTVEAMFHTYRAFESLVTRDIGGKTHGWEAFQLFYVKHQDRWKNNKYIKSLFNFDQTSARRRKSLVDRRNELFHNTGGFGERDLFEAWNSTENDWESHVLECLNFVSGKKFKFGSFDQPVSGHEPPSLMLIVHQKLKESLASL